MGGASHHGPAGLGLKALWLDPISALPCETLGRFYWVYPPSGGSSQTGRGTLPLFGTILLTVPLPPSPKHPPGPLKTFLEQRAGERTVSQGVSECESRSVLQGRRRRHGKSSAKLLVRKSLNPSPRAKGARFPCEPQ